MSGVCAEFMDQLVPQMTMLSEAFELSRNDPELAVRLLTEKIKNASGEVASEVSALGQEVNAALGGSESEPKRGREE